ncbi:hypothetical protein LEP1GSC069_1279 [Leptospira interrogans serovar Canicola str. Fiocruz LV133]|nr:hypothetical protein LEP1GSC069_1279 [Leptospira interrogans serovar Canicola str. Fiocruz LV133]
MAMAAIFYRVRTGIQWRYIPPMFGSKSTLHRRFQEWVAAGVFDKIEKEALKLYERTVKIRTKRMAADGSFARAPKGGPSRVQIRRIAAKEALKGIFSSIGVEHL